MREWRGGRTALACSVLIATLAGEGGVAEAKTQRHDSRSGYIGGRVPTSTYVRDERVPSHRLKGGYAKNGKARYYARLQCVPFARAASGIEITGNAANWWEAAAGVYERGFRPEAGSVLNFRSVGRMRLGHVAVVTAVVDSRHIVIDHANWTKGVSRNVPVVDVSGDNDWSAVRVSLGRGEDYGSVYPTYGFIYDRPDQGVMVANVPHDNLQPMTSPRSVYDEVAEAPRAARSWHGRLVLRLDSPDPIAP